MRICVMGMGYVGCVTGACFAELGHHVLGVEPNQLKVDLINSGHSPIVENDLGPLIAKVVGSGSFRATADWERAVKESELILVCVGTPSRPNGSIDLRFVKRVCEQIGTAIATHPAHPTVVIRSTVMPGTLEGLVIPALESASGKKTGKDFGLCMHPEFLREGTSIHDFYHPPKTVIGEYDEQSGTALAALYKEFPGPLFRTALKVAEMVKYADNCFHAVKVTFANEIGIICKEANIDSHAVMEIFCKDTKLNLSPYYLKPGFAFGGSCLPKDLKAITHEARAMDLDIPMLSAVLESNSRQIGRVINKLLSYKGKRFGFFGMSFKGGTDDLRSSPIVDVIETMLGKGFEVRVFDEHVSLAKLMGANKEFIEKEIPHISKLMCSTAPELVSESDVLVISHRNDSFKEALKAVRPGSVIFDLVRLGDKSQWNNCEYYGICW